jgi:hypothetical protein
MRSFAREVDLGAKKHLDSECVLVRSSIANTETRIIAASDVVAKASPCDPARATAQQILGGAPADRFTYGTAARIVDAALGNLEAGRKQIIPAFVALLGSANQELPPITSSTSKQQK